MSDKDTFLMAHLMRRAGFGASLGELQELVKIGYDETVDRLLDHEPNIPVSEYMIRRYQPDYGASLGSTTNGANWMYRMIWSDYPLREKVALFWHGILYHWINIICICKSKLDDVCYCHTILFRWNNRTSPSRNNDK